MRKEIQSAWKRGIDLGALTPEPTIRQIVFMYYATAFDVEQSHKHTEAYLKSLENIIVENVVRG